MEASNPESDLFFDAFDSLPSPDPNQTVDISLTSPPPPPPPPPRKITYSPTPPYGVRRRRRIAASLSLISSPGERQSKLPLPLKDQSLSDQSYPSTSTLTFDEISTRRDPIPEIPTAQSAISEPSALDAGSPHESLLIAIAGHLMKAVVFQIGLLISSFKFPIWLMYSSFLFVTNPFGTLRIARNGIKARFLSVWGIMLELIAPFVTARIRNQSDVGKFVATVAWGCLWAFYVGFVLIGLLATAFLFGNLVMRRIVEEPVQVTKDLNFDYTKVCPDAVVPLADGITCRFDEGGTGGGGKYGNWRLVPSNHKLQLMVSLTLPESDFNRNLGMFQVRAELLAANGKVTSSLSQPCMLRFKSSHIRFLETFLKSGTLLAGHSLESQVLRLKLIGLIEGSEPTVCVRIILQKRAEYRPGAGIPEIYLASLKLESELPLFKRMIWYWKRTIFVWLSTGFFVSELLITVLCYRPLLIPKMRLSGGSSNRS